MCCLSLSVCSFSSSHYISLICLCSFHFTYAVMVLLDLGVISLSSVLPAPLQTFCCTHTPPLTHSCSLSLSSHVPTILSLTEMKPLPFSLSCQYVYWLVLCELLFSLRDIHFCSCLCQDYPRRCSSIPKLSPFLSQVLTFTFSHPASCKITSYIPKSLFLSLSAFILSFPSWMAVSLATCSPPFCLATRNLSFPLWLLSLWKVSSLLHH